MRFLKHSSRLLLLATLAVCAAGARSQPPPPQTSSRTADLEEARRLTREGLRLRQAGRLDDAEPLLRRAQEINTRALGTDHPQSIGAANILASVYSDLGRFGEAEPLFRQALEAGERVIGRDAPDTLRIVRNLGALYARQGRHAEAEPLYRRAMEGFERSLGNDHPDTLMAVHDLGVHYYRYDYLQTRVAESESLIRRALEGRERALGRDHPDTLISLNELGVLLGYRVRYDEALSVLQRVLERRNRVLGPAHPDTLETINDLADLQQSRGAYNEARALRRHGVEARARVLGRDHPLTLQSAIDLLDELLDIDPDAPDVLALARSVLAGQRARQRQSRNNLLARAQWEREALTWGGRFALFADSAWGATASAPQQRDTLLPEVFGALQDSLAGPADRSIAEQAARRYVARGNAVLADTMRERQQLETEWARLNSIVAGAIAAGPQGDGTTLIAARARLPQVQARIAEIDAHLRAEAPEYFALISPTPLDIPAAQRLLSADEAILLVVPGPYGTHIVAVTRDRIAWHRSRWTAERIRDAVQTLRRDIDRRPRFGPNGARAFDRTTAHQLYQQLIAPVSGLLAGRRQLYVAASGSLAALPFTILVSAAPSGADDDAAALRDTRWFGDEIALVHIPSIQALALLRQAPRTVGTPSSFFGIGDPVLLGTESQPTIDLSIPRGADLLFQPERTRDGGILANISTLHQLGRLTETARELEAVRTTLGAPASSLLTAERATEPNVRATDLSRIRILLFSTHGVTVAEGTYLGVGESGLVLTPPTVARDGDDGFLAASEVTTLRLDADWVILSACNTATGDGVNSAGLGGLARAFFYAGARSLLASHWLVSDAVAPDLINRTLTLELAGTPRAEAFRQAMRAIRRDATRDSATRSLAHPYYWAPFVLIGDGR